MTLKEVNILILQLKMQFDYLYSTRQNPVLYREIGCDLLALMNYRKELEKNEKSKRDT